MSARVANARIIRSIKDIAQAEWDALANPPGAAFNPFVAHDFLRCLEDSRSAVGRTGWQGAHLVLTEGNGAAVGVAPCYLKSHSYGEYVFDHGWAEAYERAGGSYYPKLQVSVPFTPATARRVIESPKVIITSRSITFFNSRILPGQS